MKLLGIEINRVAEARGSSIADDPHFIAAVERRSSPENPRYSLDDPNLLTNLGMGGPSPLGPVSPHRAMQTSSVFACVRIIAESLAQLPVRVMERQDGGGARHVVSMPIVDVLTDHPNTYQTGFQFRELGQTHCGLWGNFYAEKLRNRLGEVVGLYPLNAWGCTPRLTSAMEKVYDINGVTLHDDEVLHIPALGYDGLKGLSPIALHRTTIGMTLAAEEFGANFYANGTRLAGALEHPKQLSPEAAGNLRQNWSDVYAGKQNAGRVAVLEEGMTFKPLTMPMEDAQYIESRKFQITDIARIYRVPPHMVGDLEKATFSNIEHLSIEFVVHTMMPWVKRWEEALNRACFERGSRYFIKFNLGGLLRGDIKSRYEAYQIGRNGGWLCPNDILGLEDMNPIPNGDTYLEPLNMKPLGSPTPEGKNNGN